MQTSLEDRLPADDRHYPVEAVLLAELNNIIWTGE